MNNTNELSQEELEAYLIFMGYTNNIKPNIVDTSSHSMRRRTKISNGIEITHEEELNKAREAFLNDLEETDED